MLEVPKAANTSENFDNLDDDKMDNQQETTDKRFLSCRILRDYTYRSFVWLHVNQNKITIR